MGYSKPEGTGVTNHIFVLAVGEGKPSLIVHADKCLSNTNM